MTPAVHFLSGISVFNDPKFVQKVTKC